MKGLFIFAAGVVAGAVAGAYLVKDKIMADAKQEINEVREYYKEKAEKQENKEEETKVEEQEETKVEEKEEYKELTKKYVDYSKAVEVNEKYVKPEDEPYTINPEEFGDKEDEGWDTMVLTYFADGVLIDDADEVIEDPDVVVGLDNLKIFEEFPDATCVYVRNEVWRTDFEILRDDWKWSDLQEPVQEKKPHQL